MSVWAVTGYKPFELGIFKLNDPAVSYIKKAIEKELRALLDEGLEWVLISGQPGVELWAAETVFLLQEEFPHLQLAVITPFLEQEARWKEEQREYYEMVVSQADFVDSVSKEAYTSPQQFRNKNVFFLKNTDGLLVLYDEETPGNVKYMYELAKAYQEKFPYDIRQLGFYDLQLMVEEEQMKNQGW
ncbi:MAG TPA: DUF1273 domain-containing protein [Chondromyces sp.]|nr:DUF1273 domain-containing protein [Chondromyces sp.]